MKLLGSHRLASVLAALVSAGCIDGPLAGVPSLADGTGLSTVFSGDYTALDSTLTTVADPATWQGLEPGAGVETTG